MNRITASIDKARKQIGVRLEMGQTTPERVEACRRTLDMDVEEYCLFQQRKTLAVADGTLTADEGRTVFALLGTTVTFFNRQPVEVKTVLNHLFKELLEKSTVTAGKPS